MFFVSVSFKKTPSALLAVRFTANLWVLFEHVFFIKPKKRPQKKNFKKGLTRCTVLGNIVCVDKQAGQTAGRLVRFVHSKTNTQKQFFKGLTS